MTGDLSADVLVGRAHELATAMAAYEDARRHSPRLVLVEGEPGIGKTRLVREIASRVTAAGGITWWARAHDDEGTPPYFLWRPVLRELGDAVAGTGRSAGSDVERYAMFDRVVAELAGQGRSRPTTVVIEDAHWGDEPSLLLLRYVARELRDTAVLLVVTHRTVDTRVSPVWGPVLADLHREPIAERISLRGLTEGDAVELFRSVAAGAAALVPAHIVDDLGRRTGGNPFFVREVARSYRDTGSLRVPSSVADVVAVRIGRLATSTVALLDAAALLGERFSVVEAADVLGSPVTALFPALDEARHAGFVAESEEAGEWRFAHALVREAVELRLPLAERSVLHYRAAAAIEARSGTASERTADIARHHLAAAVAGEPRAAFDWARRAGEQAMEALAYEDGVLWFRRALSVPVRLDPVERAILLVQLARAAWLSSDFSACEDAIVKATEVAASCGRADLVAEAVLVAEPIGALAWDLALARRCQSALPATDGDVALRARLLARLAEAALYAGDEPTAATTSAEALMLAESAADVSAVVAALKARQLALSGPEHLRERITIADRMVEAGVLLRRPAIERLGHQWRIDTHWEQGDLPSISRELRRVAWCVERVGGPTARWQLLVTKAAVAAATGRYSEALATARTAFDAVRATNHPAAVGSYLSFLCAAAWHVGLEPIEASQPDDLRGAVPSSSGEVRDDIFAHVGAALMLALAGERDAAVAAFRGAGPPERWSPPSYFRVLAWAYGSLLAVTLELRDDAAWFHTSLERERGRFVVAGAGTASYLGPVELHLGRSSAYLGNLDEAVRDLQTALAYCARAGAVGFEVETSCELAAVLRRRGRDGDADRASALAAAAGAGAARLKMTPWLGRLASLAPLVVASLAPVLSPREHEVAGLVAAGMTNREIASALYVSERTAQTHVQHILTKLGFSRRSQIAAWVADRARTRIT